MHYTQSAFWRPLFETTGAMLQVVQGCSHNACKFCTMYRGTRFAVSPRQEVLDDIAELCATPLRYAERVFLTGGDALCLPQDNLVFVLEQLRASMPHLKSVGCFARVADVARKTDEQLAQLAALGLDDVSIGAETGYDPALAFMNKGHTAADIVEQCARLDDAGIGYDLFYLAGIAGAGNYEANVRATVDVFGKTHPRRIMIHTLTLFEGADLHQDIAEGAFEPSSETDILRELRMLAAELPCETMLLGSHAGNTVRFNAYLPEQREKVVATFDQCIAIADEERLRYFRKGVKSM